MRSIKLVVTGKVQGVFYRKNAAEKAISLSLNGWVKNNPDGSVEIEATGNKTGLDKLVQWCHKGPKNAIVTAVEAVELPLKEYNDFRIIR